MTMKRPLVILTGPTAVGKTELSIQLAKEIGGEIISADSMQVYKYMNIGTAKIMPEEMQGVPHYLIDTFDPKEEFNVVLFQKYAKMYMEEIYQKGKIPIIVGGTGFYIQSVLYDIDFNENEENDTIRKRLEQTAQEKGTVYLHDYLKSIDKASAEAIHYNNIKKVIRAIEFYEMTGTKISEHNEKERKKTSPYEFVYFVLNLPRKTLYERIDLRVDLMIKQGLVNEVSWLYRNGYDKNLVSMQGLGYKEIINYLKHMCTLEEAVEIIKRDTRHFAKRQLTWFRREKEVTWIDKDSYDSNEHILNEMKTILKNRKIL